jgi:hypothetical protein
MITKENYEAYLLDLSEGNLSEQDYSELMVFLINNPELECDIDISSTTLVPVVEEIFSREKIVFDTINRDNYTFFFIAYYEKQLSEKQQKEVELFVQHNPIFEKQFRQYKVTKLLPSNVKYPYKENLQFDKTPIFSIIVKRITQVAAVLAFISLSYTLTKTKEIAVVSSTSTNHTNQQKSTTENVEDKGSDAIAVISSASTTQTNQENQTPEYLEEKVSDANAVISSVSTNQEKQTPEHLEDKVSDAIAVISSASTTQTNQENQTPEHLEDKDSENEINSNSIIYNGFLDLALAKLKEKTNEEGSIAHQISNEIQAITKKTTITQTVANNKHYQRIQIGSFSLERTFAKK